MVSQKKWHMKRILMDFPYVCQFPGADLNLILMILFMAYVRFLPFEGTVVFP